MLIMRMNKAPQLKGPGRLKIREDPRMSVHQILIGPPNHQTNYDALITDEQPYESSALPPFTVPLQHRADPCAHCPPGVPVAYHVIEVHLPHGELHQVPDVLPKEPEALHLHLEAQLIALASRICASSRAAPAQQRSHNIDGVKKRGSLFWGVRRSFLLGRSGRDGESGRWTKSDGKSTSG